MYENIKQKQFVINLYEKFFGSASKISALRIDLADLYVLADKPLSAISITKNSEKLEVNYRLDTSNTILMMQVISCIML